MKLRRPTKWLGGPMKGGPSTRSRSSQFPARARSVTGRAGPARPIWPIATASRAGHDLLHLVLGPGDRVLRRGAGHRLGDHVGQDEGVGDELDLVAGRPRPPVGVELDTLLLHGGEL